MSNLKSRTSNAKSGVRRICFVTGTRAEFGLMRGVLRAIQARKGLRLQLIVTGMHLDRGHGRTIDAIRQEGWTIDAVVPWTPAGDDLSSLARQTGQATARLADKLAELKPEVVLLTGDRVEAFAAATAAHLSGRVVAHVHGGDRASGQVDDSLRHAITKLAHLHFPATRQSARRIAKLGEETWRIHQVGSPGIDGIRHDAMSWWDHQPITLAENPRRFALFVLHPTEPDDRIEYRRAKILLECCLDAGFPEIIAVYPNSDPGSAGIIRAIDESNCPPVCVHRNIIREAYLGLLRDAAVLVGNSSSGIIEAASFGTPVVDIGPRQTGRERGVNVTTVPFRKTAIRETLECIWNRGRPRRYVKSNIYGGSRTAARVAKLLETVPLDARLRQKLIAY